MMNERIAKNKPTYILYGADLLYLLIPLLLKCQNSLEIKVDMMEMNPMVFRTILLVIYFFIALVIFINVAIKTNLDRLWFAMTVNLLVLLFYLWKIVSWDSFYMSHFAISFIVVGVLCCELFFSLLLLVKKRKSDI